MHGMYFYLVFKKFLSTAAILTCRVHTGLITLTRNLFHFGSHLGVAHSINGTILNINYAFVPCYDR
jgi:hypothetical protein